MFSLVSRPFLRADDDDAVFAELGETADHGAVLGKEAVAVQFAEVGEGGVEIIQRVGALGMAGELNALPGGEVGVNLPAGFLEFSLRSAGFPPQS